MQEKKEAWGKEGIAKKGGVTNVGEEGLHRIIGLQTLYPLCLCSLLKCDWFLFFVLLFGRCLSKIVELAFLPEFRRRTTYYIDDGLHDFSVSFARCYEDVFLNNFYFSYSKALLLFS